MWLKLSIFDIVSLLRTLIYKLFVVILVLITLGPHHVKMEYDLTMNRIKMHFRFQTNIYICHHISNT